MGTESIISLLIQGVLAVISGIAYYVAFLRKVPTREEVQEMITSNMITRPDVTEMITLANTAIKVELDNIKVFCHTLTVALEKNTDAVNDLRVELAKIGAKNN